MKAEDFMGQRVSMRFARFVYRQSALGLLFAWTYYKIGDYWQPWVIWRKDAYKL